jgi:hypothetical protein
VLDGTALFDREVVYQGAVLAVRFSRVTRLRELPFFKLLKVNDEEDLFP